MVASVALSISELSSLIEVAKGMDQSAIAEADAQRLLDLGLIYKLIGLLRITRAGRARISSSSALRAGTKS